MSSNAKSHPSLQQHALLQQLREQTVVLEEARRVAEQEFLDAEAELDAQQHLVTLLQEQVDGFRLEAQEAEKKVRVQQEHLLLLRKRQDMLRDVQGFLMGSMFLDSGRGAVFFTCSLRVFAERLGAGEMQIEAAVKQSSDGVTLLFEGHVYCWLRGADGTLYFHPEELTKAFL